MRTVIDVLAEMVGQKIVKLQGITMDHHTPSVALARDEDVPFILFSNKVHIYVKTHPSEKNYIYM